MPLTAHRRHAITSLLSVVGPICLYQYLLAPNLTVFIVRLVTQTRSSTPRIAHPSSSLLSLSAGVIASNLLAVFLHWLDDAVAMEKGLILDFVGLKTRPSFTQVLCLDAFLMFYQLFTLYIAYLADPLPVGSADKLLEPPKKLIRSSRRSRRKLSAAGRREDRAGLGLGLDVSERDGPGEIDLGKDDDGDDDENGDGGGVGDDLDLGMEDDYDYERRALLGQADLAGHSYLSTNPETITGASSDPLSHSTPPPAPLIFIIPHLHTFFSTIFTYPSPDQPVLSFAGATPVLGPRTSGELDNAEQGQVPVRPTPPPPTGDAGPAVRIPGGLNDRGFW
ncbi:hypothetical protein FFLO_06186 [Filobasidium floriforme]|uniref:DUF1746 domain-containing protein n=1 Tax=Filobasidium floriforme TaxID=5210 RepID=A0A8K0JH76_9TREE|nr:uncharacterized protein HD553DRAFT_308478 [Filobasidium floriforme]KAG7528395.1 hypothetical protein FFLO_06186 [Filobasidium floriforme]KAH8086789.1 hypothetical protein HD553DRAFT_308478 [Filobasidium floriforme]